MKPIFSVLLFFLSLSSVQANSILDSPKFIAAATCGWVLNVLSGDFERARYIVKMSNLSLRLTKIPLDAALVGRLVKGEKLVSDKVFDHIGSTLSDNERAQILAGILPFLTIDQLRMVKAHRWLRPIVNRSSVLSADSKTARDQLENKVFELISIYDFLHNVVQPNATTQILNYYLWYFKYRVPIDSQIMISPNTKIESLEEITVQTLRLSVSDTSEDLMIPPGAANFILSLPKAQRHVMDTELKITGTLIASQTYLHAFRHDMSASTFLTIAETILMELHYNKPEFRQKLKSLKESPVRVWAEEFKFTLRNLHRLGEIYHLPPESLAKLDLEIDEVLKLFL